MSLGVIYYNSTALLHRIETVFLDAMTVPNNIAHNAALRENVFMMTVCIENRLPLFLVGKPGSSKSLAKSIVVNSMSGGNLHLACLNTSRVLSSFLINAVNSQLLTAL